MKTQDATKKVQKPESDMDMMIRCAAVLSGEGR